MIVLWLVVAPVAVAVMFTLLMTVQGNLFTEVARRERAMKRLEESSGSGAPDDDDRPVGWFVHPDGQRSSCVRTFRPEQPSAAAEEAEEAISGK